MIKHYIITSLRYLLRNRGLTLINVLGLAIGICVFVLIMHYVRNELSYDKFISKQETLCRLEFNFNGQLNAWTMSGMGPDIVSSLPEARSCVRFKFIGGQFWEYENTKYRIPSLAYADSNVFDQFDFEMIAGDPATALTQPWQAVLTESMARKIFDDEDAMGKTILKSDGEAVLITGIIRDLPNFHHRFDMLLSFVTLGAMYGDQHLYNYRTTQYATYIELDENVSLENANDKLNHYSHERAREVFGEPDEDEVTWSAYFRPMKDIYFAREVGDSGARHGNFQFVLIFIIIAVFIILIACVNFINISTARASVRAMEVGIKKVVGSRRNRLIYQFLSESLIVTLLATLLGLLLVELVFPVFENIVGEDLRIAYLEKPLNLLLILAAIIIIGVCAGLYPAVYLTSFKPVSVLKGERTSGRSARILRKFLIVFQFTISIILITGTTVVYYQLQYLRNKNLGFNKDHILTVPLNREIRKNSDAFRENLLSYPSVEAVSYSYTVPGAGDNFEGFTLDGKDVNPVVYQVDPDYLDVMEINLAEGRNFSWDLQTEKQRACLVNEALVTSLYMDSVVGKHFDHPNWYVTAIPVKKIDIIGVMKDFHYKSLRQEIAPLMFVWGDSWINYANIRIHPENIAGTLKDIEKEWKKISPQYPFNYSFMDENFDHMYRGDQRLGMVFRYFAGLAIFIAIMGLFGLAAYIAERRTREIGIRKAMGANIAQVSLLLVKEFTWLILIASVIACPLAWFWARNWLQEFAYRVDLGIWIFILATVLALVIAWITVIYQTLKAAHTNPADSLKYE